MVGAVGQDKILHFGAGAITYELTDSMGMVLLAGVAKELYDSQTGGTVEIEDLIATCLGGMVISFEF
jgi:hypothetical protein